MAVRFSSKPTTINTNRKILHSQHPVAVVVNGSLLQVKKATAINTNRKILHSQNQVAEVVNGSLLQANKKQHQSTLNQINNEPLHVISNNVAF